jgi:hypothetical protein
LLSGTLRAIVACAILTFFAPLQAGPDCSFYSVFPVVLIAYKNRWKKQLIEVETA